MKPKITNIQGSTPAGLGGVVGSPLPQSLVVTATGLDDGLILIFEGPGAAQVLRQPTVLLTDTGAVAFVNVPVPVPGTPVNNTWIAWAVSNGLVSDAFAFPVGKS